MSARRARHWIAIALGQARMAVKRSAKAVTFHKTDARFAHAVEGDRALPRAAGAVAT